MNEANITSTTGLQPAEAGLDDDDQCGNIGLSYLSIGSGHRMAAEAILQAIKTVDPARRAEMVDPIALKAAIFPKMANLGLRWAMRSGGERYNRAWLSNCHPLIYWIARQSRTGLGGAPMIAATHAFGLRIAIGWRERVRVSPEAAREIASVLLERAL